MCSCPQYDLCLDLHVARFVLDNREHQQQEVATSQEFPRNDLIDINPQLCPPNLGIVGVYYSNPTELFTFISRQMIDRNSNGFLRLECLVH